MTYIPCLRAKAGEKKALLNITEHPENLFPLFYTPDLARMLKWIKDLPNFWPQNCLIDTTRFESVSEQDILQVADACKEANAHGLIVIDDRALQVLSTSTLDALEGKFALRVEWDASGEELAPILTSLISSCQTLNFPISQTLILLDLGVTPEITTSLKDELVAGIRHLIKFGASKIHLASGAYPESVAEIGAGKRLYERRDYLLWQDVNTKIPHIGFADYSTISPAWKERDGGGGNTPTTLRYTTDSSWVIYRDPAQGGGAPKSLAIFLTKSMYWLHESFSWADNIWYCRSKGTTGPGGGTEHVAEGVNHHIMHVLKLG